MTQKTVQRWMIRDGHYIVDRDGALMIYDDDKNYYSYLWEVLCCMHDNHKEAAIEIVNTDIDLEKYRNSLINYAKSLGENGSLAFDRILDDAFKENNMCKYLYTHEHVSRYISRKVWNDVIDIHYRRYDFTRMIKDDVGSHMIRELKNVKSNRDLPAFYESIQTFMLEKYMEKYGRKRLQKALKRITNEQFKGHKQMADRQTPEPKDDDGTLGGVVE